MSSYSFLNVQAAIAGPGGAFPIGSSAGVAEEGITIDNVEEKDLATVGAGGELMHSLRASDVAKLTLRLLKTSPVNAQLSNLYNFQKSSSLYWGQNVISVNDTIRGDVEALTICAFLKPPANTYSKDGAMMEWEFIGKRNQRLGTGTPAVNGG